MAFCSNCGQSMVEGTAFCGKCGTATAQVQSVLAPSNAEEVEAALETAKMRKRAIRDFIWVGFGTPLAIMAVLSSWDFGSDGVLLGVGFIILASVFFGCVLTGARFLYRTVGFIISLSIVGFVIAFVISAFIGIFITPYVFYKDIRFLKKGY